MWPIAEATPVSDREESEKRILEMMEAVQAAKESEQATSCTGDSRRYTVFCKLGGLVLASQLKLSVHGENICGEGKSWGVSIGVTDDPNAKIDVYDGLTMQDLVPLDLNFRVYGAQAFAGFVRIALINNANDKVVADIHMYVGGLMACIGLGGDFKFRYGGINM
ncbi:hypothetical protein RhiJN_07094 [Ceratobasidium sp. AG-Ba]|nr:hypothetical protein RhiJN_07094 [Ceratobasidium sp. AG-Ba]QRW07971.1 hypothetical protein RhiLY_06970 [Ceratobasidium sp. AG-Ba]